MNKALQRHAVPMKVSSIVHDSVGDLAGDRYYNGDVVAAIILGGGTNAAYVEHQHVEQREPKSREKIIGVELGSFSYSRLPITEFDADIQAESSNPSDQIFEKFVSATYLGEIVRRVLLKMAKETALFGDYIPPKLKIPYVLSSPDMAAMHQDSSDDRDVVGEKLKEIFEIADSTPVVREIVADACDIIVERGARIAAAAMVGILQKQGRIGSNKQTSVVTVDGGVYQHYRLFRNYLSSCVNEIQGSECSDNLHIQSTNGGSGIGAVFLAAAAAAASQVENLLHN
ncbi:hypothetical protein Syun_013498 [Stephania yunnanensis]|uniref:Phosphotransferase n=1 Tax=Stephania yunnanensis TaxID=152371 RepID=A0AAP0P7U3_9MAGN